MSAIVLADPALIRLGALELRWSGALLAVGLVLGFWAVRAAATRRGITPLALYDAALWSLPEALLAARVAYVLGHPEVYLTAPSRIVQVWDGGYAFGVGLLVGIWALLRHARAHHESAGMLLDAAVPGLLVAQCLSALGRAADVLAAPLTPLPPWDQAARSAPGAGPASALPPASEALIAAPLATATGALALLLAYCVLARRPLGPGCLFRLYLLLQALGQLAIRLVVGGAAPDTVGIVAWATVAVAAALSALYHFRVLGATATVER